MNHFPIDGPVCNDTDGSFSDDLLQAQRLAAVHRFAEARVLFTRAADDDATGQALTAFGCFLHRQGELSESRRQFERLLGLAHERNDDELRAVAHHNLAAVYRELGDSRRARVHQQHAWRLTLMHDRTTPHAHCVSSDFVAFANDALLTGDQHFAVQLCQLALDLSRGTTADVADAWGNLGLASYVRGNVSSAARAFRRALRLHRRENDVVGAGKDLLHLAKCVATQSRWRLTLRLATLAGRHFRAARHTALANEARRFCKMARRLLPVAQFDATHN